VCPPVRNGGEGGGFGKEFSRHPGIHALVVDAGGRVGSDFRCHDEGS